MVLSKKDAQYRAEAVPLSQWFASTDLSQGESKLTKRDAEILRALGYIQ